MILQKDGAIFLNNKKFRKKVVSNFRDSARKLEQTVDMSAQANVHKKVDSIWKVTAKDVPVMVSKFKNI